MRRMIRCFGEIFTLLEKFLINDLVSFIFELEKVVEEEVEMYSFTKDFAIKRCIRGNKGIKNLTSLCPNKE